MHTHLIQMESKYSRFHRNNTITKPLRNKPCGAFVTRNYLTIAKGNRT